MENESSEGVGRFPTRAGPGEGAVPIEILGELFNLAPTPQAVFESDGRCLLANRAFHNRLLLGLQTRPGQPIFFQDVVETRAAAAEFVHELLTRKVLRRWEINLRDPEKGIFPALIAGRSLELLGSEAFEISITDIARQKRLQLALEKEHLRLSSVFDNLAAGIFLVDREGRVSDLNRYLEKLLALEPQELVEQPYQELLARILGQVSEPEVVLESFRKALARVMERPSFSFVFQGEKTLQIDVAFFPMHDHQGLSAGWGGFLQDVTAVRDQVSWRLELLSILAHDIRTPLATIKGYTSALGANYRRWDDDMVAEFIDSINRGVDDLTHQVDQSLALTRVEAGYLGLVPEAVRVEPLIRQSLERAAAILESRRVVVDLPKDLPQVRADPSRVEEVLINLLENAVRYSPADRAITIRARSWENWVEFSVIDAGPGIPKEDQSRIFEKFIKSNTTSGGTGLGLFISRKIIDAHGGRIWVDSPPPGAEAGAAFSFTLPIMPSPDVRTLIPQRRPPIAIEQAGGGSRVLIVEDDPDMQILLRTLLIGRGYQVDLAGDGPAALDIAQASPPDIVLLDWVLPGMSGMSVCRSLRRWSDVPIMMLTSKTSQEDLAAALDAGADDYVTKPFIGSEILARVNALLRRGESWSLDRERERFSAGGLVIDFETRQSWIRGEVLDLTPTEYELLSYLARYPRQVLTYDQLIAGVWGEGGVTRHGLFAHMSRLRGKIEKDPDQPRLITTRWGIGYIFLPQG